MRRNLFILGLLLLISCVDSNAQSDLFPAEKDSIKMTPIFHATTVLEWNRKTLYIDPYHGAEYFERFKNADIIIITHAHGDHMDKKTLAKLDIKNTTLFAPQSVVDELGDYGFEKVISINNGEEKQAHGIFIAAIPMYNLPNDETARHKKGWGNGYVLTLGGKRLYFSGDTEDIPEMRTLENIDYAFVCMNLPYTMSVEAAASAVLDFKPKHVYPFHFRGAGGNFADVEQFKSIINAQNNTIDVRIRDWYK